MPVLTFNTGVADKQVEFEIFATRSSSIKHLVWYVNLTVMTPRALSCSQSSHVGLAADVAVLRTDAASISHPTVDGVSDKDHLVIRGTSRLERLPLTVFTQLTVRRRQLRARH